MEIKTNQSFFSIDKNPDSYADRHDGLSQFTHIFGAQHSPQISGLSILSSIFYMWYLSLISDIWYETMHFLKQKLVWFSLMESGSPRAWCLCLVGMGWGQSSYIKTQWGIKWHACHSKYVSSVLLILQSHHKSYPMNSSNQKCFLTDFQIH